MTKVFSSGPERAVGSSGGPLGVSGSDTNL